jgi:hypothetical protein
MEHLSADQALQTPGPGSNNLRGNKTEGADP